LAAPRKSRILGTEDYTRLVCVVTSSDRVVKLAGMLSRLPSILKSCNRGSATLSQLTLRHLLWAMVVLTSKLTAAGSIAPSSSREDLRHAFSAHDKVGSTRVLILKRLT
jgi:hypothetical protein